MLQAYVDVYVLLRVLQALLRSCYVHSVVVVVLHASGMPLRVMICW